MPQRDPPAPYPAAAAAPLRLLYVEDNRLSAILFEEALRTHPEFELRLAVDGADALQQVADWLPQLLVLDAQLPDTDGHALLRRLRELPRLARVPAFMCSADVAARDVELSIAAGFTGFWPKPIDISQIMRDLRRISAERAST